jgi:hypothetical protein
LAKRPNESDNKRMKWEYRCCICEQWFPRKEVQVDHIEPCGSLKSYKDLETFAARLFCEPQGLRVTCVNCHQSITNKSRGSKSNGRTI